MKGIYLEKNNSMEHFISNFNADEFTEIDSNAAIAKYAFAHSDVGKILFKGCPSSIGESAFEGCGDLITVIFSKLETDETSSLKNLTPASADGDFTIQVNAFNGCGSLTTLVLPKVDDNHKLVIENDAFCACGALRTVVALCDTIDFTGNPFAEEAEHLTFICKENSGVARFARENGYRSVYVG